MQESAEWDDWVAKGFEAFDVDGNGTINAQDLSAILCKDGVCAMPDVVAAALRCAIPHNRLHDVSTAERT